MVLHASEHLISHEYLETSTMAASANVTGEQVEGCTPAQLSLPHSHNCFLILAVHARTRNLLGRHFCVSFLHRTLEAYKKEKKVVAERLLR